MNNVKFYDTIKNALKRAPTWENLLFLYKIKEASHKELSYYRQKKEDFIARVATDWPKWGCGLDFFTFFIQPLFRNPFLWHFINLSDGIALSQLQIKYGYMSRNIVKWVEPKILIENENNKKNKKNKKTIKSPDLVDHAIALMEEIEINGLKFKSTQQIQNFKSFLVQTRDADIGVQAFFSFLEGVIRNAAKHRIRSAKEVNLEVRIVLCQDAKTLRQLFYNHSELPSVPKDEKYIYVIVSVNTDMLKVNGRDRTIQEGGRDKLLIDFMKEKFQSEIINESGEITPSNWGLKEMKICAAFLSGTEIEKVNSKEPNYIWITKAPPKIWDDRNGRFAYILRFEKPRYVLVIVNNDGNPTGLHKWEQQGIKAIKLEEIKNVSLDYDFLYLDESVEIPKRINPVSLPQRQIKGNINIGSFKPLEFLYQVYDLHLQQVTKQRKFKVVISFDNCSKAEAWTTWWSKNKENNLQNVTLEFPTSGRDIDDHMQKDDEFRKIGILRHRGIKSLEPLSRLKNSDKLYYQESVSYADLFFSFLSNVTPNHLGGLIIRQLMESTIMNVLVIDERIAKALTNAEVNDATDEKIKLEEKLYWMGIYVANSVKTGKKQFNYIDIKKYENNRKKYRAQNRAQMRMKSIDFYDIVNTNSKLNMFNMEDDIPIHILLIHLTRLNEIARALGISNNELVENIKKVIPYVIVHSGKGKTKGDIPTNTPFLEYSTVQRYVLQQPSKFFLVQTALSAKEGG